MVFEPPWLKKPEQPAETQLVVVAEDAPKKTAYYTLHAKWVREATPGSTVVDGYDISMIMESFLKEKLTELLGVEPEVFVQVDIR